jgi:cytochrome c553
LVAAASGRVKLAASIAAAILAAAVVLGAAAILFAWSGLYNVAATAGHWPPTSWFLHFTMRSSVRTHAAPLAAPPLADPLLVERGGGHYETGCRPCHGAPGEARNRIPDEMLPPPPYLPTTVPEWSAEQLFWIVKHGLKYTGMPAWPAQQRDDEVWAVTAFLLALPDMDAQDYDRLALGAGLEIPRSAGGEPPLPETPGALFTMSDVALIGACARCHGVDGGGRESGAFPRIDIQSPDYLARALQEYADGTRPSGIMQPVAAALDEPAIARLAAHFSAGAGRPAPPAAADPATVARGERIAAEGLPDAEAPACATCHGLRDGPANPQFPALAGQFAEFTRLQLQLFKAGARGGSAYAAIMEAVVAGLTEEDIAAVAAYYASLAPTAAPPADAAR